MFAAFVACSKDDDDDDKSINDALIGTWRITEVEYNGKWVDVTTDEMESVIEPTYATFYEDGTYSGEGALGNGDGTYEIKGETIICYVDKIEYMRYDIVELNGNKCQLTAKAGNTFMNIRCTKQK